MAELKDYFLLLANIFASERSSQQRQLLHIIENFFSSFLRGHSFRIIPLLDEICNFWINNSQGKK